MHQAIFDFHHAFGNQDRIPIFLNDADVSTIQGKKAFNEKLMTLYEEESLTSAPTCQCRHLRGGKFHLDICPKCNTVCEYDIDREIEDDLWLRAPAGIRALINPNFYVMLDDFLTKGQTNLLTYMINPAAKFDPRNPWIMEIEKCGFTRGLNYFIDNFDEIMEHIYRIVRNDRKKQIPAIKQLITENRNKLFPQYITVPNRMAFVIEKNEYNKWADKTIEAGIDAMLTIVYADTKVNGKEKTIPRKEALVSSAMASYAKFWIDFYTKVAGKKHGYFRQEIFGQRSHFTFRGVITSITNRHKYDDCYLPWKMGVQLFKDHIASKLMRGDATRVAMSPREANALINFAVNNYVKVIDDVLKELIAEHPSGRGLPILLQRNPSLKRGSAQQLWVPEIKTDLGDFTINLSVLILSHYNADQHKVPLASDSQRGTLLIAGSKRGKTAYPKV